MRLKIYGGNCIVDENENEENDLWGKLEGKNDMESHDV